jgi:HEPN domain-containing protein
MKNLKQEAERWWRQAKADFAFLEQIQNLGKHDTVCFLSQQTAENALKAYLFFKGEELIFTHSIFHLCTLASSYDPLFEKLREQVKQLDFYYVEARYPNAIEDTIPAVFYNQADADQAVEMAGRVINTISPFLDMPPDE